MVLTGALVVSIMVTFLGSTVRLFQTVNWMPIHPVLLDPSAELDRALARTLSELGRPADPAARAGLCRRRVAVQPLAFTKSGKRNLPCKPGGFAGLIQYFPGIIKPHPARIMLKKRTLFVAILISLLLVRSTPAPTTPTYVPGPSSGKISNAPGQVPDTTPPSIDLGATNSTTGNYNPANDNPGLYTGLPTQMPEGLTQPPETFWKRDTLLGDPWGVRNTLDNYGFEFNPVYTGEVMGNTAGGMSQGTVYDSSLNLPLTIYLDKIANWWDGGTIHANALWIAGRSLSADHVGDISGASNIAGYDTIRLQEFWFQQTFWSKRASIKVGLVAADAEFFTSDTASLFINGTFWCVHARRREPAEPAGLPDGHACGAFFDPARSPVLFPVGNILRQHRGAGRK